LIQYAAGLIDASVGRQFGLTPVPIRDRYAFLEGFRGADNVAVGVASRENTQ
jgi:hypothetical protein